MHITVHELRKEDGFMISCVVLVINCFEWNVDGFPGDVLFHKCSLSLKACHCAWQQEDAVAGSSHQ